MAPPGSSIPQRRSSFKMLFAEGDRPPVDPEQAAAGFVAALAAPCIRCKGRADGVHVFVPDEPKIAVSAPRPGKTRTLFASLCIRCWRTEGVPDWVKNTIYKQLDGPQAYVGVQLPGGAP